MRNFVSVIPEASVYRISGSAFSDDRLAPLLTIVVNRLFGNNDDFDWDRWTPSEARVIDQLENWISDCRGKTLRNLPLNMAFSYSNVNTGETALVVWDGDETFSDLSESADSLYYRVNPSI